MVLSTMTRTRSLARSGSRWILLLQALVSFTATYAQLVINGWHNCSIDTFAYELPTNDIDTDTAKAISRLPRAQCALIQAPLCHKGVSCTNNKTIELFIKRVLSSSPTASPDVWFIQGGPGASSEGMESGMQDLIKARNGKVNVYTVDHRGTGRSNRFDCMAAQATTSGSPQGSSVTPEEFAGCSADLMQEYGNDLSAFSITSAASDIGWLINGGLKSDAGVVVYGVSYGTAVVERLIHLNVTAISGYVLDGVATSSGAGPAEKFEYFSTWDVDFGAAADRFLEVCKNDTFCGSKFGAIGPAQTLKDLYSRIDSSDEAAACTGLSESSDDPPSYSVRKLLGALLQIDVYRTLIPVVIFRMNRCSNQDKTVLQNFVNVAQEELAAVGNGEQPYDSDLLYELISYSEMWEYPQPHNRDMLSRFTNQLITDGETYTSLPSSCLYLMDKESPGCNELNISWESLPKDTLPIAYKHDQYWNVSAKIGDNASVLILNGKLDPQTHYRYAEYLYAALQGGPETQKKLLLFEYLPHGTIFIPDEGADATVLPCALQILASYVKHGGTLAALDTTCMQTLKPINFDVDPWLSEYFFGTEDAYNGQVVVTDTAALTKYKILFIVFASVSALLTLIAWILFYRLRRRCQNEIAVGTV